MTSRFPTLFIAAVAFLAASAAHADKQKVGVVGAANQKVVAVDVVAKKERELKIGDEIFFEEIIKTDGAGNAQLMFLDKSSLTVGANAELKIDKFVFDPSTEKGEMGITSTKGAFRFIGGSLSKEKPVKIKTPVGTIGIRGSIAMYAINGTTGATTSTFVSGSEMTMENLNGDVQTTTTFGTGSTINTPTTPPTPPAPMDSNAINNTFVAALTPPLGTTGGATEVPQANQVGGALSEKLDNAPPLAPGGGDNPPASGGNENAPGGGGNNEGGNQPGNPGGTEGGNPDGNQPPAGSPSGEPGGGNQPAPDKGSELMIPGDPGMPGEPGAPGMPAGPDGGTQMAFNAPMLEGGIDGGLQNGPIVSVIAFDPNAGPTGPLNPTGLPPIPTSEINEATKVAGQDKIENQATGGACNGSNCPVQTRNEANCVGPNCDKPDEDTTTNNPPPPGDGTILPPPDGTVPPPPGDGTAACTGANCPPPPDGTATNNPPPPPPSGGGSSGGGGTVTPLSITATHYGLYAERPDLNTTRGGTIEAEITGSTLRSNTYQNAPFYEGGEPHILEIGANTGFNNLTSFNDPNSGETFFGHMYRSSNNNFLYYHISGSTGNQINAVAGLRQDPATLPVGGFTHYAFLPELYLFHQVGADEMGFFDYNIVDDLLLGTTGVPTADMETTPGLVVSWDRRMFLTANLDTFYSSATNYLTSLTVAFGKVDNATGGRSLVDGRVFDFDQFHIGASEQTGKGERGFLRADETYGTAGNAPDGLLLKGVMPDSSYVDGTDPFAGGVTGHFITQPVAVSTNTTVNTDVDNAISATTTGGTWQGYSAGFVVHDVSGTKSAVRFMSNSPSSFVITRINSGTNSAIHSNIMVEDDSGITDLYASFGSSTNGATNPKHAFISNEIYAMQLDSVQVGADSANNTSRNGVMVSSFAAGGNVCSGCNYVDWGVWAMDVARPSPSTTVDATIMPYVAGEVTTGLSGLGLSGLGTATYNGAVVGSIKDLANNGQVSQHQGTFTADVNFASNMLTDFTITSFAGYSGLSAPTDASISPTGQATFTSGLSGGGISNALVNGALFGPAAENIGGNFRFDDTGGQKSAAGVFLGTK